MFQSLGCKASVTQEKPCTSAAAAARISAFLEQARVRTPAMRSVCASHAFAR
jgi:hypothetical protein